jgi:NAD(P)-dependent dehydrogenase (short-subunit alcohol dehydrogenase family)
MSGLDMKGKVGIVTGGSQGIGRACVEALAEQGAQVVVFDLAPESAPEAAALALKVNVADSASIDAAFKQVTEKFGRVNFLINNAGIDIETEPSDEWLSAPFGKTLDVNLAGAFHCMRKAVALMRKNGGGSIVNIGSVAAIVGTPTRPAYAASKHALVGLTRTAAIQFGPDNIRSNIVCPGGTRTPLMEQVMNDNPMLRDHIAASCPLRRLAEPSEIAQAVLWLASGSSSYVNGAVIPVDGGYTAA